MMTVCWCSIVSTTVSWNLAGHYYREILQGTKRNELETPTSSPFINQQKEPDLLTRQCQATHLKVNAAESEVSGYEILPHPPSSLDLSSTDYQYFKLLGSILKEELSKSI